MVDLREGLCGYSIRTNRMWECEPHTGSHSLLFTFVNTFLSQICAEVQKSIVSTYFMGLTKGGNAKFTCYESSFRVKVRLLCH